MVQYDRARRHYAAKPKRKESWVKKQTRNWMIAGGIAAGLLLVAGLDARLTIQHYAVESEKVEQAVRLAVLTDLHSCKYGQNQQDLLDAVADQDPDLVLLCGDIVDDELWKEEWRALLTVKKLAEQCPVYYASGNHEYRTGRLEEIKELLRACGAVVLDGYSVCAAAGEQMVQIGGVDDPKVGELRWEEQLAAASGDLDGKHFSILLTHRPERVDDYAGSGFDLVLAGHAHGGQWRLPGLINGLLAPNQGFFPQYAGGQYALGQTTLIVSRGLARESTRIPRIFNRPELVIVDVEPPK